MPLNANEQDALNRLRKDGYFNDESCGLGKRAVEAGFKQLKTRLIQHGYVGRIEPGSKFYDNHGQVAWAFDPTRLTREDAIKLTDEWVDHYK